MRLDPNFSEFIALLRAHEARFLIVGGYAVAFHGHPRYTGDLDVWVLVDDANARGILAALDEFGFAEVGLGVEDFTRPDHVVQLGDPPLRIDVLPSVDGVDFAEAYERRIEVMSPGHPCRSSRSKTSAGTSRPAGARRISLTLRPCGTSSVLTRTHPSVSPWGE